MTRCAGAFPRARKLVLVGTQLRMRVSFIFPARSFTEEFDIVIGSKFDTLLVEIAVEISGKGNNGYCV